VTQFAAGTVGHLAARRGQLGRHPFRADRIVQSMDDRTFVSVPQVRQRPTYCTLVSAFREDKVERWLYPELPDYLPEEALP
jgi:hypothetical protein